MRQIESDRGHYFKTWQFLIPIFTYSLPFMSLSCPTCQSPIHSDDRFCENCGTPLQASIPTAPPVILTTACQKCGAPATSIDADGFCDQCGFRNIAPREPQEFDQVAQTISETFAGRSDRGIMHHQNEDYFAIAAVGDKQILVVCDGVSSSTAPQTASQIAAKTACEHLETGLTPTTPEQIQAAIQAAQNAVAGLSNSEDPPSTTIVAAVIEAGVATIGWIGDSRAYWISADHPKILTTDHSWFNDQVESGQLTAAEAQRDPKAHAITRWLGADADYETAPVLQFPLPGTGYLVLCSDGLWNYLADAPHLATLMTTDAPAETIVQRLVDYANAKGGKDNITVALSIV
jgi:PPM family protein phosphatase